MNLDPQEVKRAMKEYGDNGCTEMQLKFAYEYMTQADITQAQMAINAGYSPTSAAVNASKLLKSPGVKMLIEGVTLKLTGENAMMTNDEFRQQISMIARHDKGSAKLGALKMIKDEHAKDGEHKYEAPLSVDYLDKLCNMGQSHHAGYLFGVYPTLIAMNIACFLKSKPGFEEWMPPEENLKQIQRQPELINHIGADKCKRFGIAHEG